jgi:transposase
MKPTPNATIEEAIRLMSTGTSTRETAHQLKISPTTASNIYTNNKENMPTNKGGRPRKIRTETVNFLKLNMKHSLLKTAKEARDKANELLPEPVSTSTIRRRLQEAGLIAKRKVKRPALKQHHIKGRITFV